MYTRQLLLLLLSTLMAQSAADTACLPAVQRYHTTPLTHQFSFVAHTSENHSFYRTILCESALL